ncbi:MAG: acyltransferase, partial [Pseudomonadota bacterium]
KSRNHGVDALRGLCILAVITVHALMLVAPRLVHLRCDVLGPTYIPCGAANSFSFVIANVFAVCVFAFLSGLVIPSEVRLRDGFKRGLRLHIAALGGCLATAAVLVFDSAEIDRLARLFAPLPFTKSAALSLQLQPDWQQLLALGLGLKYPAIAMDTAYHLDRLWPPIWCIPWFLAAWLILVGLKQLPGPQTLCLAAAALLALPLSDQGIISIMIAGHLCKPLIARLTSRAAIPLLIFGLVLASAPFARVVSSDWVVVAVPTWFASLVQTAAACFVATSFLRLLQRPGNTIMQWLGRHSLAIYALHWPILLVLFGLLLGLNVPPTWLANTAIACAVLPAMIGIAMILPRRNTNIKRSHDDSPSPVN